VIGVLLYVSQDDFEETNVCNEIKRESPKQIHGIDNEDCPSFLGNEFETNQQTGTLTEEAADGK
jgi:hypothetical protein